jgi:formate dehydrogenase maturation protein FdhE
MEEEDLGYCPSCGSEAVGEDNTEEVSFLECFQCNHQWDFQL